MSGREFSSSLLWKMREVVMQESCASAPRAMARAWPFCDGACHACRCHAYGGQQGSICDTGTADPERYSSAKQVLRRGFNMTAPGSGMGGAFGRLKRASSSPCAARGPASPKTALAQPGLRLVQPYSGGLVYRTTRFPPVWSRWALQRLVDMSTTVEVQGAVG